MKNILKTIRMNESTMSSLLGAAAVIMVTVLLWSYFKGVNTTQNGQTSSSFTEKSVTETTDLATVKTDNLPVVYTIKPGDNLWTISETVYGTGFEYTRVAQANPKEITNPSMLTIGTKITIPKMETAEAAVVDYTVKPGDSLWNISQSVCGSGFEWTRIATDNNLANPGVIHTGNVLKIKCLK